MSCATGCSTSKSCRWPATAAARTGTVDFGRDVRNLAFGGGPHGCLGAHLARMEMRVALEEWHRRIPEYQVEAGASVAAGWPAALIGLDSLPLVYPRAENQPVSDAG